MASDTPDTKDLKSWQEVFRYPIPTVRKVEQELRRDIASNREKLRALVGTRYRELLGTAETIIEMNAESTAVESKLTSIGIRCNANLIGKKSSNLTDINRDSAGRSEEFKSFAGQLTLLHRCTTVAGRLLRKHDSPLVASKLMVISRSLYKILSQSSSVPPFLESIRSQLSYVQKLIRRRINRILGSSSSSVEEIIDSMLAFCLSNNASSLDVITYFHKMRLTGIEKRLDRSGNVNPGISKALSLYIQTLQHTKVLFSRRLSDALGKLQAQPLLEDHDVQNMDDLDLDILERCVVPDVKNFTPWIKSEAPTKQLADKILKGWSQEAFQAFLDRGATSLQSLNSFSEIVALRKKTIDIWLASAPSRLSHSPTSVLKGLRDLFNTQMSSILTQEAQQLLLVKDAIQKHLNDLKGAGEVISCSLWDPKLLSVDVSDGAGIFKNAITQTLLGQDARIMDVLEKYRSWLSIIEKTRQSIADLRSTKWEDPLDGDDEENEELQTTSVDLLAKHDPKFLEEEQRKSVRQAFLELQNSFDEFVAGLSGPKRSDKTIFILRLIRDLRRESPFNILRGDEITFAQGVVPRLHDILTEEVLDKISTKKILPTGKLAVSRVPGRLLWEGQPELPSQPLPSTFRYLKRLVEAMESLGQDLWNPAAVHALKIKLQESVAQSFSAALQKICEPTDNSTKKSDVDESEQLGKIDLTPDEAALSVGESEYVHDWKLQLLLDAFYLRDVLSEKESNTNPLEDLIESLQGEAHAGDGAAGTLQGSAHEYWNRTQLLLGLLAS